MNISIIGASAGIGLATVKRALTSEHTVTTLSRRPIKLEAAENLKMLQGSALKEDDLQKAIENADVIIVCLGTGMNTGATTLFSDFAKLIVKMQSKEAILAPVLIVTGFGAGDSRPYLKPIMRPFFRFILNKIYDDKAIMEDIISKSTLNWEIVRPGLLNNKKLTGKYRVETELFAKMNIGSISRNDVADFLVKEATEQRYIKMYPALANK